MGWALGGVPLPDYGDTLVLETWHRMNRLIDVACEDAVPCLAEPLDEAIQRGTDFQTHVLVDARITYLIGLAHRRAGRDSKAQAAFEASVALDPKRVDAWHDLGELHLSEGRLADADKAFARVSDEIRDHRRGWLGPWRQAEVAGERGDAKAFERHLKVALERGFTFRTIAADPRWARFAADPTLGPSVRKLVTVYASPDLLNQLKNQR